MLSPHQITARDGKLTASRVACLMTGDEKKITNLWRELVGDPEFEPDDLSNIWPVRLGEITETINLDWYELKTGRAVSRRGEVVIHPVADWAAATLDGFDKELPGPIECKHVSGREPLSKIIDRYQPQLQWQMMVTHTQQAILSIIEGCNEPLRETIPFDQVYSAELWRRAEAFMQCVWALTPPIPLAPASAPVVPTKAYDFTGRNEWAANAVAWIENIGAKKAVDKAEKELKAMVPGDAMHCSGHGIDIRRDRAGRLSIRESAP
jgi:predicted phage-related endonuclease